MKAAQIDFYVLDTADAEQRLKMVCRLANKVQRLGHRILVLTESEPDSRKLDTMMWTWSQSSFLPHAVFDPQDPYSELHPVLISQQPHESYTDILINLQDSPVIEQGSYHRILEVVDKDDKVRIRGKEKYRAYKDNNFNVNTHNMLS